MKASFFFRHVVLLWTTYHTVSSWSLPCRKQARKPPNGNPSHDVINQHDGFSMHLSSLKTSVVSAVTGLTLLFAGSTSSLAMPVTESFAPPPRILQEMAKQQGRRTNDIGSSNNVMDSWAFTLIAEQNDSDKTTALLDEVWTLVDKYYIDRSFGGTDWNAVHDSYTKSVRATKDDASRFRLVSEMINSLGDKYTRMLDPNAYAAIQKYDLIGVGVTLMPNDDKDIIVGAPPVAGSEADRAGIRQGDFITAINGQSTKEKTAFDIIDQIAEDSNSKTITMKVRSSNDPSGSTERVVTMSRSLFPVKNPISYKVSEVRTDGTKVGYIKISEFNTLVKGKLENALADLEAQGVNAYVLDIRQNTGGAFQSAVEVAGLFIEDKVATSAVDSDGKRLDFRTPKGKLAVDTTDALVVWIDGRSASASEVLAGSLRDNCRAVTMGQKSFGKGLIQGVYGLKTGAGLVMTVARYETPSGNDIQGIGISPDFGNEYLPLGPFGIGTDTSKVDFGLAKQRLMSPQCHEP